MFFFFLVFPWLFYSRSTSWCSFVLSYSGISIIILWDFRSLYIRKVFPTQITFYFHTRQYSKMGGQCPRMVYLNLFTPKNDWIKVTARDQFTYPIIDDFGNQIRRKYIWISKIFVFIFRFVSIVKMLRILSL